MNLLKRNKRANIVRLRAAEQLATYTDRWQRRVADYLGQKTAYWNRTSKIIALTIFCLLFGGCSLYLLIKAFI
jgi:hypothetical protein